jgi:peptidoglycan/xylan/chitin deacetylase (PgdA/CDA1 family)
MNVALASLVKQGLLGSGHYPRRLRRDAFPGVAVLCYHGICADRTVEARMSFGDLHTRLEDLAAHCRFIRETCNPITLEQWRQARAGGELLPARPVLFTFDEGYRPVFTHALPILRQFGIPAVLFVWSDPVEQRRLTWYDAVARRLGEPEVERLKAAPYEEWRRISEQNAESADDSDPCAPLTVSEIRALARTTDIEIGGHTAGHPILAQADLEMQREEIVRNKSRLEAWTGRPVRAFAYPNGEPGTDYTHQTVKLVGESGFDFGFTTRYGFATSAEPPLELSRFLMLRGVSAAELGHRLSYSWRR